MKWFDNFMASGDTELIAYGAESSGVLFRDGDCGLGTACFDKCLRKQDALNYAQRVFGDAADEAGSSRSARLKIIKEMNAEMKEKEIILEEDNFYVTIDRKSIFLILDF